MVAALLPAGRQLVRAGRRCGTRACALLARPAGCLCSLFWRSGLVGFRARGRCRWRGARLQRLCVGVLARCCSVLRYAAGGDAGLPGALLPRAAVAGSNKRLWSWWAQHGGTLCRAGCCERSRMQASACGCMQDVEGGPDGVAQLPCWRATALRCYCGRHGALQRRKSTGAFQVGASLITDRKCPAMICDMSAVLQESSAWFEVVVALAAFPAFHRQACAAKLWQCP